MAQDSNFKDPVKATVSKGSALLVTTLTSFLTPFMGSSVNIALPSIGQEFDMDAILLSWVATSYLLACTIFLLPFGRLADIYGRKRVYQWGVFLYILCSFLSAISTSATMLLVSRFFHGVAAAMIFGTGLAILTSVFPPGERGKVLGINVAAVYLGLSLGPFLGGFLTQQLGWRSIFISIIPLGIISLLLTYWKLKGEWVEAKGEKVDVIGTVIYSLMVIAIMYGFSLLPGRWGILLVLLGLLGFWAFVRWENSTTSPILDIPLLANNRVFAFSNLAALIHYSATFAVGFLLSLYLQYIKGLSPQQAGFILVSQPVVMTLFSPFAGKVSDRIEPRIVASTGMSFTVIGLFLLTFITADTGLHGIILTLALLGFGFALFSSPNTNAVMSSVEKKLYGVASATLGTMRLTGNMLSMGIVTLVFSITIGRAKVTPENAVFFLRSVKVAFTIFAVLCFCGIFASLSRGNVKGSLNPPNKI
jgi:EmrB/QacA subfamily drug resistance transporter